MYTDDAPHEECGIVGVYNLKDAAFLAMRGLFALQHRGQEGAGIISRSEKGEFFAHRGHGLVSENFPPEVLHKLIGRCATGHVRYSTSGDNSDKEEAFRNIQPFFAETAFGGLALAHNGNLINAAPIRTEMIKFGHIFNSSSDSEVILQLAARYHNQGLIARIIEGLKKVRGSYSLVMLTDHEMIGVRDPFGFRPLVLGKLRRGWVLASETCALDILDAKFVREVEPGEMVVVSKGGIRSLRPFSAKPNCMCDFEYIYFARPDSVIEGQSVQNVRVRLGEQLAKLCPATADIVSAVPDSGVPAALGFSKESGIQYNPVLVRNHYVGRTFIDPVQATRAVRVRLKLNANRTIVAGKRIVLVDDSIVRGTTIKVIVAMLRKAGAKEIHLRISCPPIKHSCYYGIDTPNRSKLFANRFNSIEKMRQYLKVDSLAFLSLAGLHTAIGKKSCGSCTGLCSACFTGKYPVPV
jgi:amidophosphoribosyltransferase